MSIFNFNNWDCEIDVPVEKEEIDKATDFKNVRQISKERRMANAPVKTTPFYLSLKYWLKLFGIIAITIVIVWTVSMLVNSQEKQGCIMASLVCEPGSNSPSFADAVFTDELVEAIDDGKVDLYGVYLCKVSDISANSINASLVLKEQYSDNDVLNHIQLVGWNDKQSIVDGSPYKQWIVDYVE